MDVWVFPLPSCFQFCLGRLGVVDVERWRCIALLLSFPLAWHPNLLFKDSIPHGVQFGKFFLFRKQNMGQLPINRKGQDLW